MESPTDVDVDVLDIPNLDDGLQKPQGMRRGLLGSRLRKPQEVRRLWPPMALSESLIEASWDLMVASSVGVRGHLLGAS